MLNFYMEEPGMVCSDWLRENEGLTPAQLKQLEGLSQLRGVEIDQLNGVEIEALNGQLGIVPDWQFYPQPPPIGTGKYSQVTVDLPGDCASYGICGAMGLGANGDFPMITSVKETMPTKWLWIAMIAFGIHSALRLPLAIVDGVHGYKRNREDGASAAAWGALGFLFPISTTVVALAQGYGKPK